LCFPTIITEIIFIYFYHDDDDDDDMIIKIAYYFTNQRILSPKICGGIQTKTTTRTNTDARIDLKIFAGTYDY
jgi:hypothetical protein